MQNSIVDVNALPSIKPLVKLALAPAFPKVNLYVNAVFFIVATVIAIVIGHLEFSVIDGNLRILINYLPLLLIALGILWTTFGWFADKAKFYALREHDISYFSGLIFKRLVTQPTTRIQHVEVTQGPIERFVHLGKLQVYSAGSSMQTFSIPGLPIDVAHQLRQRLTQSLSDPE